MNEKDRWTMDKQKKKNLLTDPGTRSAKTFLPVPPIRHGWRAPVAVGFRGPAGALVGPIREKTFWGPDRRVGGGGRGEGRGVWVVQQARG